MFVCQVIDTLHIAVSLYGFNLAMTGIAFVVHVAMQYLEEVVPGDTELPFQLTTFTGRLNNTRPFQLRGLNFDPQRYFPLLSVTWKSTGVNCLCLFLFQKVDGFSLLSDDET